MDDYAKEVLSKINAKYKELRGVSLFEENPLFYDFDAVAKAMDSLPKEDAQMLLRASGAYDEHGNPLFPYISEKLMQYNDVNNTVVQAPVESPHALDIKQVIVVRKDLNMRKGKLAAQVAHASNAFLFGVIENITHNKYNFVYNDKQLLKQWIANDYKKIVVYVNSEEELIKKSWVAAEHGVRCNMIYDLGLTEFHGEKTLTCAAFGPDASEKLDKVTGDLPLL